MDDVARSGSTHEFASLLGTQVPPGASLAQRAYVELRERIVTLAMPPGSLVHEHAVMDELGVSRTPIREALLRLALEQLVTVVPRRGTFVSEVNVGSVGQVYELRRELETLAAGWAATRRSDAEVPAIEALIDELKAAPPDAGVRAQVAVDRRAHGLVWRLAGNPLLAEALSSGHFLAMRIWFLADGAVRLSSPHDSLADVLGAIRDEDPESAARCARTHGEISESSVRGAL